MGEDEFTDAEARAFSEELVQRIRERAREQKISLWKSARITAHNLSAAKRLVTGERIPWPSLAYGTVALWIGALLMDDKV